MKSLVGEATVLTDVQARLALKELIEKHLKGGDPDYVRLIEIVLDPSRQVPIRGMLEDIRRYNKAQYTKQELELIDDLLYMYG
ncbi:hypothetical protein PUP49_12625 [Pseudomonas chlororaphis]|uniref:hypothetical protein n=1 Tax=Pseudomonas chlororaphis TaxID=587753 RepID=UPI0006A60E1B|nr:hypothetical protein [Pseudomonas chlororaphis]WDG94224.1 hypothetical protein PUP49_12625 [Pseudomonas chlororaphis]